MGRSSEAYQEQQDRERLSEYDDFEACRHEQENLSGMNGESYFSCHPLPGHAQDVMANGSQLMQDFERIFIGNKQSISAEPLA